MKKITYYGGFDNYILLVRSEKMWSGYGEYLRRVMLAKLSDSSLDLENKMIFGTEPNMFISKRKRMDFKNKIKLAGDLKHSDLTFYTMNRIDNYSRRQLKILKAYNQGEEAFEKYKEEAQKIKDWENEYYEKEKDEISIGNQKIDRWLHKKSKTSPKFYKIFEMQGKDYQEDIEISDYEFTRRV
jgi:large subunit ribosomal protein L28